MRLIRKILYFKIMKRKRRAPYVKHDCALCVFTLSMHRNLRRLLLSSALMVRRHLKQVTPSLCARTSLEVLTLLNAAQET